MATAGGLPRNPPEIRRLRYQNGDTGTRTHALRGQGSAVPSLHPEGVGCNQPLLAHSLLQRVLQDEAKGDCTHALDFELKGSFKQCSQIWREREICPASAGRKLALPQSIRLTLATGTSPGGYGLDYKTFPDAAVLPTPRRKEIGMCTDVQK